MHWNIAEKINIATVSEGIAMPKKMSTKTVDNYVGNRGVTSCTP